MTLLWMAWLRVVHIQAVGVRSGLVGTINPSVSVYNQLSNIAVELATRGRRRSMGWWSEDGACTICTGGCRASECV